MVKRLSIIPFLALACALGSCTVHQTTAPSLSGPSEFAWSVGLTATPDSINQDGASQSSVVVRVFGPSGQAAPNVTLRLDTLINGAQVDYGTLSARTVITGTDGRATVTYTAPPAPPAGSTLSTCRTFNTTGSLAGQCVSIVVTPIGSTDPTFSNNFSTSQSQSVEIRLMPTGLIVPSTAPVAAFVVSPTPVSLNVATLFDGSTSCPVPLNGTSCTPSGVNASTTISSYAWAFGDGATASGRTATHSYTAVGTFTASLTVTNSAGVSSPASTQQIVVDALAVPTGSFTVSPSAPNVDDVVNFAADGVTAAPGHTITQYSWNFGDSAGASATGLNAQHTYTAAATYTVTLSVADDSGQKQSFTKTVTVGTGAPTATFTFAVTNAGTHQITTDGSGSTAQGNASISTYAWTWGDGASTAASSATVASHPYGAAGTYTVTLTVKDSLNRSASFSQSVTVP